MGASPCSRLKRGLITILGFPGARNVHVSVDGAHDRAPDPQERRNRDSTHFRAASLRHKSAALSDRGRVLPPHPSTACVRQLD